MKTLAVMLLVLALQGAPPLRALEKGDQSNVDDAKQVAVRTSRRVGRPVAPALARPRPSRASISRAKWSSAYSLAAARRPGSAWRSLSALVEQGILVVRFERPVLQATESLAQVITSPYHLVAVPRHSGDVKFEKQRLAAYLAAAAGFFVAAAAAARGRFGASNFATLVVFTVPLACEKPWRFPLIRASYGVEIVSV